MIAFFFTFFCTQFKILRIPRSREVRQSWLSTLFTTLNALAFSFPVVLREKPELVKFSLNVKCSPLGDSRKYLCTTMNILIPSLAFRNSKMFFILLLTSPPPSLPKFLFYFNHLEFPSLVNTPCLWISSSKNPLQSSELQTKPLVIKVWIFSEITHCH